MKYPYNGFYYDTSTHSWYDGKRQPVSEQELEARQDQEPPLSDEVIAWITRENLREAARKDQGVAG